jgi:hypothetical protein
MTDAIKIDGNGPYYVHDPRARLPVQVDWSAWLTQEQTTITGSTWTATAGITTDGPAFSSTVATIFVSAGTVGTTYTLRNTITCANGITDSRSIRVVCRDR